MVEVSAVPRPRPASMPLYPTAPLPRDRDAHLVPRTLHVVWVGSPVPASVRAVWRAWDRALNSTSTGPAWIVVEHTEPSAVVARAQHVYGLSPRAVADLVRIEAVSEYGGVYVDSDCVPTEPTLRDQLAERPAWVGVPPGTEHKKVMTNGFFGFPPNHPFLGHVWNMSMDQLDRGVTDDHFVAGPRTWYRAHTYAPAEHRPERDPRWLVCQDPATGATAAHSRRVARAVERGVTDADREEFHEMWPTMLGVHP